MRTKVLLMAMSAIALGTSSCSNDEVTEINKGNEIRFTVTSNKASRATATTTESITEFKVYAFNGATAVPGLSPATVSRTPGENDWSYGTPVPWPAGNIDFFSFSPVDITGLNVGSNPISLTNYTVTDGKTDLLYAFNNDLTKDATAQVPINFRHALSQIIIKAKNTKVSDGVIIKVKGVKIGNVKSQASLVWPTETTSPTLDGETGQETQSGNSWGTWTTTTVTNNYSTDNFTEEITLTNEAQELKNAATPADGSALFLMPQTLVPWVPTPASKPLLSTDGSHLLINCNITVNGTVIWPEDGSANFDEVAIPLTSPEGNVWKQGKKYVYTLVFGEGFGYDPDTEEPITSADVQFIVTVDDYQEKNSTSDVDMKVDEDE